MDQSPELEMKIRAVALLIASVPAGSWADVLPKVSLVSMLQAQGEGEASHTRAMIEAAVAVDHERLQPMADGAPSAH